MPKLCERTHQADAEVESPKETFLERDWGNEQVPRGECFTPEKSNHAKKRGSAGLVEEACKRRPRRGCLEIRISTWRGKGVTGGPEGASFMRRGVRILKKRFFWARPLSEPGVSSAGGGRTQDGKAFRNRESPYIRPVCLVRERISAYRGGEAQAPGKVGAQNWPAFGLKPDCFHGERTVGQESKVGSP